MDETPIAFVARWTEALRSLQSTISSASVAPSPTVLSSLSTDAQALGAQLTESADRIPNYELSRCERELKVLLDSISSTRSTVIAKPKFSFKRSTAPPAPSALGSPRFSSASSSSVPPTSIIPDLSTSSSTCAMTTEPQVPTSARTISSRRDTYLSFPDINAASLAAPSESSQGGALLLSSLQHCFVDLLSASVAGQPEVPFSALYLYDLKRCVVLLEPTAGSVMLHGCQDCLFVLGCHQYRMHKSADCRVLLQIGGTPIIEQCSGLSFGPYPAFLTSLLLPPTSAFANVQDFDHPFASATSPSPSFQVLTTPAQGSSELPGYQSEGAAMRSALWRDSKERSVRWRELLEVAVAGLQPM